MPSDPHLEKYRSVVYHGGAGGGIHRSFENFLLPLLYVSFEPNSQSQSELLLQKAKARGTKIIHDVVNAAVSDVEGKHKFFEYFPSPFSSFLTLKIKGSWRYRFEKIRLLKTDKVRCSTIDKVAKKRNENPTFICLDIQGYELKTLRGAALSLSKSTIGVRCEVNFLKIYEQMPSMDDISQYLERKGFFLARLEKCGDGQTGISSDCGPFSKSWDDARPAWADAIFIKTPEQLIKNLSSSSSPEVLVAQYIAFCLANECHSLALDMLYALKSSKYKYLPQKMSDSVRSSLLKLLSNHLKYCNSAKLKHNRRLAAEYKKIRDEMTKYLNISFR